MRPREQGRDREEHIAPPPLTPLGKLLRACRAARARGRKVVFTNGVFDILHAGHVRYLKKARSLGGLLVVGLNSDSSARRIKGPGRPIVPLRDRAEILLSLKSVDRVTAFGGDKPLDLIRAVRPDVLVKGADWARNEVVGREIVEAYGGRVARIRVARGRSTTNVIRRILRTFGK